MARHSGGFVPTGEHALLPIDMDESQAKLGSNGSRGGGSLDDEPAGVKRPSVAPTYKPEREDWLPRWVREYVEKDAPATDVIDEVLRRALAAPDRQVLLEASLLANELGRDPSYATHVRRAVAKAAAELLGKDVD